MQRVFRSPLYQLSLLSSLRLRHGDSHPDPRAPIEREIPADVGFDRADMRGPACVSVHPLAADESRTSWSSGEEVLVRDICLHVSLGLN